MDENEFLKAVQEKLEKMNEYDRKTAEANLKNRNDIVELITLVNDKLTNHQVGDTVSNTHIRFYADFIGNILPPIKDKKLSHLIFDKYFPAPALQSYYHFTSFNAIKNIISTQQLRLSNLRKRFRDGEYSEFYADHGMDGYRIGGSVLGIDFSEKSIMSEIFFLSLTSSGIDYSGQTKWTDFGEDGYGVRIEFEVTPKHNDFREVYYSLHKNQNCIPLLKDLFVSIKDKYQKPFNFTYSSKIGAFYIKGAFQNENEFRFLIKRTSDDYNAYYLQPTITDAAENIAYIEIPLLSEFADFKIKSVQPGYNCSDDDIKELNDLVAANDTTIDILNKARKDYGI
ncbi:MAG: hypothetical protein WCL14_07625 [Bacteroidota bacterium]